MSTSKTHHIYLVIQYMGSVCTNPLRRVFVYNVPLLKMLKDVSIELIPCLSWIFLINIGHNDTRAHFPKGGSSKQVHIITPHTIPLSLSFKVCISIAPGILYDHRLWPVPLCLNASLIWNTSPLHSTPLGYL